MIGVPEKLLRKFDALLSSRRVPRGEWGGYRKWLRFHKVSRRFGAEGFMAG